MMTYFDVLISYKDYFERVLGVDAYIMHHKQEAPSNFPYITLDFVNANPQEETKLKDLVYQPHFFTFGVHSDTMHGLNDLYKQVKETLMYRNIPLLDSEGVNIGEFKIDRIMDETTLKGGDYERFSSHHRTYFDVTMRFTHVKTRRG